MARLGLVFVRGGACGQHNRERNRAQVLGSPRRRALASHARLRQLRSRNECREPGSLAVPRVALLFAALVIPLAFLVYGPNGAVLRAVALAGVGVVIAVQTRAR